MRQSLKNILCFLFVFGAGGALAYIGWSNTVTRQLLARSGAVAEGRVVEHWKGDGTRRSTTYALTISYTPANKPSVTRKFTVDGDAYYSAVKSGIAPVRYLPDNPDVAVADSASLIPYQILMWSGVFFLMLGALATLHAVRNIALPTTGT